MSGGAPIPVAVKGQEILCIEDIKERADANLPEIARGKSRLTMGLGVRSGREYKALDHESTR